MFLPIPVYFFVNARVAAQLNSKTLASLTLGSFLTTMQTLSAMSSINVTFPSSMRGVMNLAGGIFVFRIETLGCIIGNSVLAEGIYEAFFPYAVAACLFGASALSRRIFAKNREHKYRMRIPETFNTFGTVCFLL